jgi:heme/copper-type cytochrome/quinol oxidase subunit 2
MTNTPVGTRARRITDLSLASRLSLIAAASVLTGLAVLTRTHAQAPAPDDNRREVAITAREGAFAPPRVEVKVNDLVKVTFSADDGPHSFNIDAYRIAKRARPGHPAVFEFRADQAGTFPYYCNLKEGDTAHDMRGELVVR